jgi:hypothetical protein
MTSEAENDPARLRKLLDDVAAGRVTPVEASALLGGQAAGADPAAGAESAQGLDPASDGGDAMPAAARRGPATSGGSSGSQTGDVWSDVSDVTGTASTAASRSGGPGVGTGDTAAPTTGFTRRGDEAEVVRARRVVVRAVGRRVRIIGEPSVSTVSVDGAHVVRREGATLTVTSEGELGASLDGFTLMRSRSFEDVRDSLLGFGRELAVRVNPDLEVEVEVTAGGVSVERVPKLSHVRVTAGSAKVLDAEGPLDLLVQAGSAKVEIRPTNGSSRLRVESGSLDVRIGSGSDVRVRSDSQLGKVSWQGSSHQGSAEEVTVGNGAATLNLEVVMGSVQVRTG